jgi:hypothetical protein
VDYSILIHELSKRAIFFDMTSKIGALDIAFISHIRAAGCAISSATMAIHVPRRFGSILKTYDMLRMIVILSASEARLLYESHHDPFSN